MRFIKIALFIFLGLGLIGASWYPLHGDVLFHTDIARDFLLFADITTHNPITLIGPRSGGIPGVFHGPLWLYLNIPAYLLGQGNPVIVGWFWVLLACLLVLTTYFVARRLTSNLMALMASVLVALRITPETKGLFNAYGAVLLTPVFFYFFQRYLKTHQQRYLIITLFTLGVSIQFQIAFALPVIFLVSLYIAPVIFKKKLFSHLTSYFALLPPLSTYVIFELRHQFLQLHAILNYLGPSNDPGKLKTLPFLINRFKGMFIEGIGLTPYNTLLLNVIIIAVIIYVVGKRHHQKKLTTWDPALLFIYLYGGYWLITFLFSGVIWSYYYWPFMPLSAIVTATIYKDVPKQFFYVLMGALLLGSSYQVALDIQSSNTIINKNAGSWQFNKHLSEDVFKRESKEFGYYIYTPDLFGYSQRYAMDYMQKSYSIKGVPFEKRDHTYLIIAPPPDDKPYLNATWWRQHQIAINSKPIFIKKYPNNFIIEEYQLTHDQQRIPSDPNLINSLYFR